MEIIALPKADGISANCLLLAAISVTSARFRNVPCNWTLRPATSTRKGVIDYLHYYRAY
ncbi:hypothetical protein ACNKHK_25050 [Shigella flexneri]